MNAIVASHQIAANKLTADVVAQSVINSSNSAPVGQEIIAWAYGTATIAMLAIYGSGVEAPHRK